MYVCEHVCLVPKECRRRYSVSGTWLWATMWVSRFSKDQPGLLATKQSFQPQQFFFLIYFISLGVCMSVHLCFLRLLCNFFIKDLLRHYKEKIMLAWIKLKNLHATRDTPPSHQQNLRQRWKEPVKCMSNRARAVIQWWPIYSACMPWVLFSTDIFVCV